MTEKKTRPRIPDEVVAQVRNARTAKEAHRLTGVSLSHAKAIRQGVRRCEPGVTPKCGSLIGLVVDLVEDMGEVTVDDILPYCEGRSRPQVINALQNASHLKRIRLVAAGKRGAAGGGRGSCPSTFGPIPSKPDTDDHPLPARGDYGIPRVASVWQLGAFA